MPGGNTEYIIVSNTDTGNQIKLYNLSETVCQKTLFFLQIFKFQQFVSVSHLE